MSTVGEVCSDISHDSALCQELMDAVMTVHNKFLLGKQPEKDHSENQAGGSMPMKDPAVIKNKSVRKGNRMKPRSEIEAERKATQKRKQSI